ncbi:MAG: hypothetical protein HFG39_01380 [Lachnospiraceae bacterium]|nr:hypothetical protein [Lachnospiraceae bacterium]
MGQNNIIKDFGEFQKRQKELVEILEGAADVTRFFHMSKEQELEELSKKVKSDTFKIMVTGTFKNGKSTFINALLGEEILPAYALPCTAVINELKYGEKKQAVLYFRNPLPDPLPDKLAERARKHMDHYKGRKIPPLEISYDEIEDYVVIPMGTDEKQMKLQSPYEKVELFYPLELLKNGVEIIDSPGLNEDETRTKVTKDYLTKVDAILYVLNASAICAGNEMEFVKDDLQGNDFDSVFFVVNRFDQIRPREQPQIRQYAEVKLKEVYKKPELFCISALEALEGRLSQDEERVEKSSFLLLEKRLTEFLTKQKGRAKLVQPAKKVKQILSNEILRIVLPREYNLLEHSLDDIYKLYKDVDVKLDSLKAEQKQRKSEMDMKIERSGRNFERLAKKNVENLIHTVPVWIENFNPKTDIGIVPTKKKVQKIIEEITDYLKENIRNYQNEWKQKTLEPVIEEEAIQIFQSVERDISEIYTEIDEINVELSGGKSYNADPVPFWQRAVGVAGGLVLGDVGLAVSGGINGIGKEMATTAAFELGAGAILGVLGFLNPFTIMAVIGIAFLGNLGSSSSKALEKLKRQIEDDVIKNLGESEEKQAEELADNIQAKFKAISDQVINSVSKEIGDIEVQMKTIIDRKEQGQLVIDNRKVELGEYKKKIDHLNSQLDALIFKLVEV